MEQENPKSRLYTRTGDRGTTSLANGQRVDKNDVRVEAYGTADELNAAIGLLAAECRDVDPGLTEELTGISSALFDAGSYLASLGPDGATLPPLSTDRVTELERAIDRMDAAVEPMRCFLLPGGHRAAAQAHVARTVCRRTERRLLDVVRAGYPVDQSVTEWFNRLSDYLFILSRYINKLTSTPEIPWRPA